MFFSCLAIFFCSLFVVGGGQATINGYGRIGRCGGESIRGISKKSIALASLQVLSKHRLGGLIIFHAMQ